MMGLHQTATPAAAPLPPAVATALGGPGAAAAPSAASAQGSLAAPAAAAAGAVAAVRSLAGSRRRFRHGSSAGFAAGSPLRVRSARCAEDPSKADSGGGADGAATPTFGGAAAVGGELSEEELLELELAEASFDLELDEEEEEEWRQYDAEVEHYREMLEAGKAATLGRDEAEGGLVEGLELANGKPVFDMPLEVNDEADVRQLRELMEASGLEGTVLGGNAGNPGLSATKLNGVEDMRRASEIADAEEVLSKLVGMRPEDGRGGDGEKTEEDELDSILRSAAGVQATLKVLLEQEQQQQGNEANPPVESEPAPEVAATAAPLAVAPPTDTESTKVQPWVPGCESISTGPGVELPEEYRRRLSEGEGGVVVSGSLGENTVVLVSCIPEQPELLPLLSETFRAQRVRIMRGWLETNDTLTMDVFEVCDANSGESLSEDSRARLEAAIMQALRAPPARLLLLEIDDQVPRLDAFFGLPAGGSRPPALAETRLALAGGPFLVREAIDLGRVLAFRGDLAEGVEASKALDACQRCLVNLAPDREGEWECYFANGTSGLLLLVLPARDLEELFETTYDQPIFFALCTGITMIYAQAAAPAELSVSPPIGALVVAVLIMSELARRLVGDSYKVRLGLPLLFPSPAVGTFGAATRAIGAVQNATAAYDMAAAASVAAFMTAFALIAVGLLIPASSSTCAWVNPNVVPFSLQGLLLSQAPPYYGVCSEGPGGVYLPASTPLIAGIFGAIAGALNTLPLARLDGQALSRAASSEFAREAVLPWSALILLGCTALDMSSESLFPTVLGFGIFTFGLRPSLVPHPIYRDNVTVPEDLPRRVLSVVLFFLAFAILIPWGTVNLLVSGAGEAVAGLAAAAHDVLPFGL